jgi:NADPH:quinone reductase-like Zn-dependent oxidoreductase
MDMRTVVLTKYDQPGNGTLQKYIAIPSTLAVRKPPLLSHTHAAALPLAYLTVYTALVRLGRLPFNADTATGSSKPKRSVLILGGSSGTGGIAIQLAKKMGLNVVATCSGAKAAHVRSQGVDEVRWAISGCAFRVSQSIV